MVTFSANLGYLWTDRRLPDAIVAAHNAGFDAVECHWPYDVAVTDVNAALAATDMTMLGLNTRRGSATGDMGLAAVPGREAEARFLITEAIDYAQATSTDAIHVMAGVASGTTAHATFCANLADACQRAADHGITVLIEPLNRYDAPGYFLADTAQARSVIEAVDQPNLRLMFDCYHTQVTEGDVTRRLTDLLPIIGHVQIAAVPDRGAPDHGELDYRHVLAHLDELGWHRPVGAEYRPDGDTDASLAWLDRYRDRLG